MKTHPLKLISLMSLSVLILCQIALVTQLQHQYKYLFAAILIIPLIIPIRGLWQDKRYTFKWVGFLTLFYFSIGVSEGFASPDNRLYSILTIIFSSLLFLGSIYYSRYLRVKNATDST